jgi:hypothetical protein
MGHFIGHFIKSFISMLGGISVWLYANFMNIVFSKSHESHIGYYLYEDYKTPNLSGLSSNKLNFVVGIFAFVFIITVIEYYN